jgi:hypothetical protein
MRIALGKQNEIALSQADGFFTGRMTPARAPRDQVVFDDVLGARHYPLGNLA